MKVRIIAHRRDDTVNIVIPLASELETIQELVHSGFSIEYIHLTTANLS